MLRMNCTALASAFELAIQTGGQQPAGGVAPSCEVDYLAREVRLRALMESRQGAEQVGGAHGREGKCASLDLGGKWGEGGVTLALQGTRRVAGRRRAPSGERSKGKGSSWGLGGKRLCVRP